MSSAHASYIKALNIIVPFLVFFFDPAQSKLMLALLSLMIFDTLTAAYYYYSVDKHNKAAFFKGFIAKFFKYFGALAGAHLLEYFLVGLPYTQELDTYVLSFLAFTEFKSFYGWLYKFGLKVPMPPKIKSLLDNK